MPWVKKILEEKFLNEKLFKEKIVDCLEKKFWTENCSEKKNSDQIF